MAGVEDSVLRLGDEFSRLSTSPLWEVMKSYYAQQGLRSWREEIVPSYITCNVVVAKTVVQLVVAMCDEADARRGRAGPETRVTVLEFGAGSANLMYWVWLLAAEHGVLGPRMRRRKLRFVASDCSSSIIDELLEMPVWAAATKSDKGVDLAVVDALGWSGEPVRTQRHGWTVGGAGEAVCGLCGYVFDTLPHDAFAFSGGAVSESWVALQRDGAAASTTGMETPGERSSTASADELRGLTPEQVLRKRSLVWRDVALPAWRSYYRGLGHAGGLLALPASPAADGGQVDQQLALVMDGLLAGYASLFRCGSAGASDGAAGPAATAAAATTPRRDSAAAEQSAKAAEPAASPAAPAALEALQPGGDTRATDCCGRGDASPEHGPAGHGDASPEHGPAGHGDASPGHGLAGHGDASPGHGPAGHGDASPGHGPAGHGDASPEHGPAGHGDVDSDDGASDATDSDDDSSCSSGSDCSSPAELATARLTLPIGGLRLLRSLQVLITGDADRRAHGDPADAAGPAAPGQPAPLAAAKGRVDCAPPSGLAACIVLDKGFSEPHSFVGLGPPELALHGSFSLMVNFHACELAAAALGGCWATAGCDGDDIRLAACVLPPATERRAAPRSFRSPMKEAYPRIYEAINSAPCGGPDAFFHLSCALPDAHDVDRFKRKPTMPLTSILALCQISDWDSDVFARSRAWIAQLLPTAREEHLQMLRDGMARMISMEYPLCVHKDVPFEAARMFQAMGWFGRASELFRVSIARHGEVASSALNLGLCLAARGEHAEAALWLDKAGALEPATNGKRLAESCRAKLRAEAAAAAAQTATEVTLGSRTVLLGLPE